MVGVQNPFVGQGASLPTVQGMAGGRVTGVKHWPLLGGMGCQRCCFEVGMWVRVTFNIMGLERGGDGHGRG